MSAPKLPPEKHDNGNRKKREERNRRLLHFGFSYLITSLIMLWLFQILFVAPLARQTEIPYNQF